MNENNKLIDLMKECDQKFDEIFKLRDKSLRSKYSSDLMKTQEDLTQTIEVFAEIEDQIEEITKSEELIKLYFYRFLVSGHKTEDQFNGYYLRAKESAKQLFIELLNTMEQIVKSDIPLDNSLDIESKTHLLSKVFQEFQSKAIKSMAENDIKTYESKQLVQKMTEKEKTNRQNK